MGKLLRFELRRLFRKKSLYICALIASIVIVIGFAVSYYLATESNFISYGSVWPSMLAGAIPNALDMLLPILVSILVCEDFKTGAMKTLVNRGYGRNELYCAKFVAAFLDTVLLSVACWVTTYIMGLILVGDTVRVDAQMLLRLSAQFVLMFVVALFSFVPAILLRKTAIGIVFGIVGVSVISMGVSAADAFLLKSPDFQLSNYWVATLLGALSDVSVKAQTVSHSFWVAGGYIVLLFIFGFALFRKKDI